MTKPPSDHQNPSTLSPPHPHLARYLAPGDHLLDDEQLCICGHLEGDHQVLDDCCSRCQRCDGFVADTDDVTAPGFVLSNYEAAQDLKARSEREAG